MSDPSLEKQIEALIEAEVARGMAPYRSAGLAADVLDEMEHLLRLALRGRCHRGTRTSPARCSRSRRGRRTTTAGKGEDVRTKETPMSRAAWIRAGLLLMATLVSGACTAILGTFDFDGPPLVTGEMDASMASCNDRVKNGDETDVDCGGKTCPACAPNKMCSTGTDCASGVCVGARCVAPTCMDSVKNGDETDVDCGGSCPTKCGPGKMCAGNGDCAGSSCSTGTCVPTCTDGVKSGGETDVDCGGPCPACKNGDACAVNKDCTSATCIGGKCLDSYVWAKGVGAAGMGTAGLLGLALDTSGNSAATGYFTGTADFGSGSMTSVGNGNGYLARYDASGNSLGSSSFAGSYDVGRFITICVRSSPGDFLLAGGFTGTTDFGGGPITSAGSYDIFLANFDMTGFNTWTKRIGGASAENASRVAADSSGGTILVGTFDGTTDLGGGPIADNTGFNDLFLLSLDPLGNYAWAKTFGNGKSDMMDAPLALDASGNVITGDVIGPLDLGGGVLPPAGPFEYDVYVAKYDSGGSHQWSKRFGDSMGQTASAIAVDASGSVIITGTFAGTIDFGCGPLAGVTSSYFFVTKLDASGNCVWSKAYSGTSNIYSVSLAVDSSNNVIVLGDFQGSTDLGGGTLTSAGDYDVFVLKLEPSGQYLWSKSFGDSVAQNSIAVAAYDAHNVLVGGNYYGTMDFGGGPLPHTGLQDVFLAKLQVP